jgi:hypothetical protein
MRMPGVRLEGRRHSPIVRDSVRREREILRESHLRRLKIRNVVWLLERKGVLESRCLHLIERQRIEIKRLFRAHVEAVINRDFAVLVYEVIAVDTVDGHGSGGIDRSCGHSETFVWWCDGKRGEKDASGLG